MRWMSSGRCQAGVVVVGLGIAEEHPFDAASCPRPRGSPRVGVHRVEQCANGEAKVASDLRAPS